MDLPAGKAVIRRYCNRRIGKFLKELDLAEGRSTGIPKILRVMAADRSPLADSMNPMLASRNAIPH
jgi:ATP-dependent DNA helicase RecG